jgi:hypothetical protein
VRAAWRHARARTGVGQQSHTRIRRGDPLSSGERFDARRYSARVHYLLPAFANPFATWEGRRCCACLARPLFASAISCGP